ncbi:hypothetical protein V1477_020409 [Vespula maculifrons]|uniref:Uncharacterized protein n=1 Tax=Vespula maculifrons TaxID=7453 RepID=A0ABD2ALU3_VESMC
MATSENRYDPVARDRNKSSIALRMTSLNSCAIDSKRDTVSKEVSSPRRWRKRTNPSRQNYITIIYLDTIH